MVGRPGNQSPMEKSKFKVGDVVLYRAPNPFFKRAFPKEKAVIVQMSRKVERAQIAVTSMPNNPFWTNLTNLELEVSL